MTRSLPRPRRRAGPRECGETLIELVVAVTIMGAVVAVVIGALTSIVASAQGQRTDAKAQAVLTSFAERAKSTPLIPCATPPDYNARDLGQDDSGVYKPAVTEVSWWNGTGFQQPVQTTLTDPVDAQPSTSTIEVADATAFAAAAPTTTHPATIKVGEGDTSESMSLTDVTGDTLTVKRAAITPAPTHETADAVTLCMPDSDHYNLQLLELAVAGPATGIAGKAGAYASTISVSKRGPLLIPSLFTAGGTGGTGDAPAPAIAGDPLSDAVSLTYVGTPTPGVRPSGTITFDLYPPSDAHCTGTPLFTDSVAVSHFSAAGDPYISGHAYLAFLNTTGDGPGVHHWTAAYSGDAAFQGASSVCGSEGQSVDIEQATPTLTAVANPDTAATGDAIGADDATLAGGVGPDPGNGSPPVRTPTGTVTFALYGRDDDDCSHAPLYPATGDPALQKTVDAGNGSYTSPGLPAPAPTFTDAGTYHWVATYSGDANNASASTSCTDPDQAVTVSDPPATPPPAPAPGP